MNKKLFVILLTAVVALPIALFGCKGKTQSTPEEMRPESAGTQGSQEEMQLTQATEPAQVVATETIPPTAAPQMAEKPAAQVPSEKSDRDKDIQKALKSAGFYTGTVDGKIGPKTKRAVEEFQKSKGLKADGKVGSKTWAELEKYLKQ